MPLTGSSSALPSILLVESIDPNPRTDRSKSALGGAVEDVVAGANLVPTFRNVNSRFSPCWITSSSIPDSLESVFANPVMSLAVTFATPPVDLNTSLGLRHHLLRFLHLIEPAFSRDSNARQDRGAHDPRRLPDAFHPRLCDRPIARSNCRVSALRTASKPGDSGGHQLLLACSALAAAFCASIHI